MAPQEAIQAPAKAPPTEARTSRIPPTALAQGLVGAIALIAGFGSAAPSYPWAIPFLTAFFAALWLVSAWLLRRAARALAGAAP